MDPLLGTLAFAIVLVGLPLDARDPGPSPRCPSDMRLVVGTHHDEVQHLCVEPREGHCYEYFAGITGEEGPATPIEVCMDAFEAPNRRGQRPLVMQSFDDAEAWCRARDKRVCTEQEWEIACEGPEDRPLVYGWKVDAKPCNSAKPWRQFDAQKLAVPGEGRAKELARLWQGEPSGHLVDCVSADGVYDLIGNVEEWVASRPGRRFRGALKGGFWAKPWTGCRGTNDAHAENFTFYETGFRCCADPKAEAGAAP